MNCINFDDHFQTYTAIWVEENAAKYGNNYDRMEEKMPEVYLQWLNLPADWLDGMCPGTYFNQFDDAPMLVEWMRAYFEAGIPVPDQLLERITDLGAEAELFAMLQDGDAPSDTRLTAITLLSEMESRLPMPLYIEWITGREDSDERAEMAAEALTAMGRVVVAPVLAAVDQATRAGQETFLDVLCNFPGDDAIYALAASMFVTETEKRAQYASLLGKLGDERAIPLLTDALNEAELSYLDFIELRNALEAVGGEAPVERAFDGDPYYESLRRME